MESNKNQKTVSHLASEAFASYFSPITDAAHEFKRTLASIPGEMNATAGRGVKAVMINDARLFLRLLASPFIGIKNNITRRAS